MQRALVSFLKIDRWGFGDDRSEACFLGSQSVMHTYTRKTLECVFLNLMGV